MVDLQRVEDFQQVQLNWIEEEEEEEELVVGKLEEGRMAE